MVAVSQMSGFEDCKLQPWFLCVFLEGPHLFLWGVLMYNGGVEICGVYQYMKDIWNKTANAKS